MQRRYINVKYNRQHLSRWVIMAFMLGLYLHSFSQPTEYTMKAVAFEKLAMFITWPDNSSTNETSQEFIIAVLGQNPFNGILEEVYAGKKIKERKVKIIYLKDIENIVNCDILFISGNKLNEVNEIIKGIKGRPILTVSETEGFVEAGCFINFYEYENKLRFEINQKGMMDAGFIIDYRLLRVSKVLNPT